MASGAGNTLAATLVIARANGRPGRQVMSGAKRRHIGPHLGDQTTRSHVVNARNPLPELNLFCKPDHAANQSPFRSAACARPGLSTRPQVLGAETDDDRPPCPPKPAVTPGS